MRFGGYLSLILRLTYYLIGEFQVFSLDNSMIKKLYSADQIDNSDDDFGLTSGLDPTMKSRKAYKLEGNLTKRAIFSYKYRRQAYIKYFGWCCCCRPGDKRSDFLFKDAKEKLSTETDLLEIVKNMRIYKFASDIVLKPRQRDLVNFFDAFKLRDTKLPDKKKPHEFSARLRGKKDI